MSNHHAGNPHWAPHAETGSASRHTNPHMPPAASAHFSTGAASANTQNSDASAHFSATPAVPRRTPFRLTDARHLIQTPHTPHHAASPRTGSSTNPHMPAASAAPLPQTQPGPAIPTPTAHFRHRAPTPTPAPFTLRDILLWCVLPVLIVLGLRLFVFGMYAIPSGSMENTIMPGDRVITTRLSPRPIALRRGNIIVFKDPANWLANEGATHNSDRLIKRLIGLPGDTVECAGGGAPIVINGVPIDESAYLKPGVEPSRSAFSVTVPAGRLFVLGDNRANSADSRAHTNDGAQGLVPVSDVEGVAFVRYWPLNRVGWLSAHHDVFRDVPTRAPTG